MRILIVSEKFASLCGLCSVSDERHVRFKYGQKVIIVIFLIFLVAYGYFCANEILYQRMVGDIYLCLFACAEFLSYLTVVGSYLSIIVQMANVRNIFNGIQKIFDRCRYIGTYLIMQMHLMHQNTANICVLDL